MDSLRLHNSYNKKGSRCMIAPSFARRTAHAGNPGSLIFPTTNIVYAGRLVQTHDLSGATLIPLHKTSSHLPLHDSSQGLDDSQMNLRVKLSL